MDFLWDAITGWLKDILVSGIMSNLSGMFDSVNEKVGDITTQVGMTPQAWNGSIFNMIQRLSQIVVAFTRWKTAVFLPRTSGACWPSSMKCLTAGGWKRPRHTSWTAPIKFETNCPKVGTGQRAALSRCCPFAFFHHPKTQKEVLP